MAKTGFAHHIGTFLLFCGTILLLITTISSPVVDRISIMNVSLGNGTSDHDSSVRFGTFGYCLLDAADGNRYCTGKHIGYNPAEFLEAADSTDFNGAQVNTAKALTRVMVLHPIACVLAFIAFLFAAGAGICGALLGAFTAITAWIICVVVMATDFVLFGIIKKHINDDSNDGHASFSAGMWTLVAAMVCLFLGTIVVFLTCCSSRMHRQRHSSKHAEGGYANGTTVTKRHFWQRGSRRTRY
ncbi:SUR7/PalI family-domain-containing protein [Amylocarpus encephaloides]|uniref:SUR7/PalI family-domain-containing protein n=1 Tax=Amylocarpus encephaloides TaxID=45428 RepID=A0A9P7Y7P6_9HELO|nr:SUR7/PalI family-domain-containing protein [Amylocarpus encephaloides]